MADIAAKESLGLSHGLFRADANLCSDRSFWNGYSYVHLVLLRRWSPTIIEIVLLLVEHRFSLC